MTQGQHHFSVARATENEGKRMDTIIPMSEMAKDYMEDMYTRFKNSKWLDTDIINDTTTDPGMLEITKKFNSQESSLMHLILETVDRPLCSILLFTPGKNIYTKRHAQILDLLKEPFSIAIEGSDNGVIMHLGWDTTRVAVPFTK